MLTKKEVRELRTKIETLFENYVDEKELGFRLTLGRAVFGSTVSIQLECSPVQANGTIVSKIAEDFKRYCHIHDLKPDLLGAQFNSNGMTYKIIGMKPQSRKYPILGERSDGKVFKFHPSTIKLSVLKV